MAKQHMIVAYDLTNEKDDSNRQVIRDKITSYCGQSCQLSESCYLFESNETIEGIFTSLESLLDETTDRLSVIKIDNIKSNLQCADDAVVNFILNSV